VSTRKVDWVSIVMTTFYERTGIAWDQATIRRFIAAAEEADRAGFIGHRSGARWDDKNTIFDRLEWAVLHLEDEARAQGELPPEGELPREDWKEWRAARGKKAQIAPAMKKLLRKYNPNDPALSGAAP
jgi:hypothetical protein